MNAEQSPSPRSVAGTPPRSRGARSSGRWGWLGGAAIVVAALFAIYAAVGIYVLPAVVKSQIEDRAADWLGQRVRVGSVAFNPFTYRLEVNELVVVGEADQPLAGFRHLLIDLEVRGLFDRAWTFREVALDAPFVNVAFDKEGGSSFDALLARMGNSDAGPPRFVVARAVLADGRIEVTDRRLEVPRIARVEPLRLELLDLSSLPGARGSYRLSALAATGAALETRGEVALSPLSMSGVVALVDLPTRTLARALSSLVAVESPTGELDFAARFDISREPAGGLAGIVEHITLQVAGLRLAGADATAPMLDLETLAIRGGRIDLASRPRPDPSATEPWQVLLPSIEVSQLALTFADEAGQRQVEAARLALTTSATVDLGPSGWSVGLRQPRLTLHEAKLASGSGSLLVPQTSAEAASGSLTSSDARMNATLEAARLTTPQGLAATFGSTTLDASAASVGASHVEVSDAGTSIGGSIREPTLALERVAVDLSGSSLGVADATLNGAAVRWRTGAAGLEVQADKLRGVSSELRWQDPGQVFETGGASISSDTLEIDDGAAALRLVAGSPTVSASDLTVRSGELHATVGSLAAEAGTATVLAEPERPLDLVGAAIGATLSKASVRSEGGEGDLLRLGQATLSGGVLRLRDQVATAARIALRDGTARVVIDEQGELVVPSRRPAASVTRVEEEGPVDAGPQSRIDAADAARSSGAWRLAVAQAELDRFQIAFEDRSSSPPLVLGIPSISARMSGLDTASSTPAQARLQASLEGGGSVRAEGTFRASGPMADLELDVRDVRLPPLQTYLSRFAELQLASGTASALGRLRYGDAAEARLSYEGSLTVKELSLHERDPDRRFLGWKSLAAERVSLTIDPDRADVGDVRIVGPFGRLIIAADSTLNVSGVLKNASDRDGSAGAAASDVQRPGERPNAGAAAFPLSVGRISVSDGVLEFADRSLRTPFSATLHDLQGHATGLGTDPARSAQLQFDATVNEYGSAKIDGTVSVFNPAEDTNVDMVFRNLDLTNLSPYVAKFAGYRIADGRLALDLHYEVDDGKLRGENRVVLRKIELGEKVDSPSAFDLPIELALAVLKDGDGVIDIEFPVSGDLTNPTFDYGAVIRNAIGSLLGRIASAPFRALASLFGRVDDERFGSVAFRPGSDSIAPPEREKLDAIADALKARPQLKLVVPPTYALAQDRPALQSRAVRADLLRRMGVSLPEGEDPGRLDTANPRVRNAIEDRFRESYAPEVLGVLKRRAQAGPDESASAVPAATGAAAAAGQGVGEPPPAFYERLLERLVDEQPVADEMLQRLAERRGQAIVDRLTAGDAPVAADRVSLGELQQADEADNDSVALDLRLGASPGNR